MIFGSNFLFAGTWGIMNCNWKISWNNADFGLINPRNTKSGIFPGTKNLLCIHMIDLNCVMVGLFDFREFSFSFCMFFAKKELVTIHVHKFRNQDLWLQISLKILPNSIMCP